MRNRFNAQLIGRLGQDAKIKKIKEKEYYVFNIAHNYFETDKALNRIKRTQWIEVYYLKNGNKILDLKKGFSVLVEGSIKIDSYKSKNGDPKSSVKVYGNYLNILHGDTTAPEATKAPEEHRGQNLSNH
jgi:single-stranded DNA-binding protein